MFQLPALKVLLDLPIYADFLDQDSLTTLLRTVTRAATYSEKKWKKLIVGAAIFAMEKVDDKEISKRISILLGINEDNRLEDDEKLYYVSKLYRYVDKILSEEERQNIHPSLLKDIHEILLRIKQRDNNEIHRMLHATPSLNALRIHNKNFSDQYHAARDRRYGFMQDASRESYVRMLQLIDESFAHFHPIKQDEQINHFNFEKEVRRGLSLCGMLEIENTYSFLSPAGGWFNSGSDSFKLGLEALNISDLSEIPYDDRVRLLKELLKHLHNIQKDWEYMAIQSEKWKANGFDLSQELKTFIHGVESCIETQKANQKHSLSTVGWGVSNIINYGGKKFVPQEVVDKAVMATVGALVIGTQFVPFNVAFYLSSLVGTNTVTLANAYVYTYILGKTAHFAGEIAKKCVDYWVSTEKSSEQFWQQLNIEDKKVIERRVNTLLILPVTIVGEDEKKRIRLVFGLRESEKLRLQPKSTLSLTHSQLFRRLNEEVKPSETVKQRDQYGRKFGQTLQ